MNWGKGLTLALIAFAGMMTWFVIKSTQHPSPLVTDDYYGAELKFQGRIDEVARAKALSAPVGLVLARDMVTITFPAEARGKRITGSLSLLRPNDPRADRTLVVSTDSLGVCRATADLLPGRYNAALSWTMDGSTYLTEDKVYVP